MKKILVPTDFSPIADNAIDYAIELADQFKSELYFYHVYSFNKKIDYNWNYPEDEQPFVKKLEEKMDFTKKKFMDKIIQKNLLVHTVVEEGDIYTLFKTSVIDHDISLVIMGSKGATGLEKVIFGSFAASALGISKVPVLVVPPEHSFLPLERLVMATDLKDVSQNVLLPLKKIATKFDAEVILLNVNTNPDQSKPQQKNIDLPNIETTYQEVPLSKDINSSINDFIEKNKCNLLCMIRREKSFLNSLLKKSITKTQVFNNQITLLVLPEK